MSICKKIVIIALAAAFLAGCGKEGPFGNTPGPKKPEWMKSTDEISE